MTNLRLIWTRQICPKTQNLRTCLLSGSSQNGTDDGFNAAEDDFLLLVVAFGFVDRNAQVLVLLMGKQSLCAAEHHGNAAVGEGVVGFRFTSARLHSHIPFSVHA